jgi:choline dehydrogenase-like flavoprotein
MNEIIGIQMAISGLGRVKLKEFLQDQNDSTFPDNVNAGWHHMGVTRMANDPKNGVVDRNCKVHGMGNLFIAGSSCFVTAGGPNPTFTLIALSIRLSDFVKEKLKSNS